MTKISFDREAVGIVEKAQWTDAEDLGQVGVAVTKLGDYRVAEDFPQGDCSGVVALRNAMTNFATYLGWATQEYSDACALLGSGAAEYSQNADDSEKYNEAKTRAAAARLGVGEEL